VATASVYSLGKYLNIADLKALAQAKFRHAAHFWSPKPYEDFPAIINAVWDATSDKDVGFRDPILEMCAEFHGDIIENEECMLAMIDHGDFGVDLVKAVAKHYRNGFNRVHVRST